MQRRLPAILVTDKVMLRAASQKLRAIRAVAMLATDMVRLRAASTIVKDMTSEESLF